VQIDTADAASITSPRQGGPGQEDSPVAMPLEEFTAEVIELIEAQPDARELQVERVKFLRYGEARGDYDQVVATLNAADPHGKPAR
jgi:uncharacterized oxidoreductase